MARRQWFAPLAWTGIGAIAVDVLIETSGDRITSVLAGTTPPPESIRLDGIVLPGLANAHSHAFHRALRGHGQDVGGDFWAWRNRMYAVAGVLDPDRFRRLATAAFTEMALAGITAVGEFHYLHHGPGGVPYDDPNEMGKALADAADVVGIRLTLLDTCYLRSGFEDEPLDPAQKRFVHRHATEWADRASDLAVALGGRPRTRVGAAIHSVRAVDSTGMAVVAEWSRAHRRPLHFHLSEQPAENAAAIAATGLTPTELLEGAGALGPGSTAVHATHLTARDISLLGQSRTTICLCPVTERDLADGMGPALALTSAGAGLSLGTDNHTQIDLFAEARCVEHHDRLSSGQRGHHDPHKLLETATAGGMRSMGWEGGRLEPGALADFIVLDRSSPRLAGTRADGLVGAIVFAATASDVTEVVVGGTRIVSRRRHATIDDAGGLIADAVASVEAAIS